MLLPWLQYDVREDEEQNVKLRESIDLLLAAGYFRARIKGLTPFDKVAYIYLIPWLPSDQDHTGLNMGMDQHALLRRLNVDNSSMGMHNGPTLMIVVGRPSL